MTNTKQEQNYNNKVTEIVRVKQVISERPVAYETTITSSVLAKQLGIKEIGDEAQEVLLVVALSTKNQINAIHRVFTGSINQSVAHPREIFRSALLNNAARILIYHNHPSGDVLPSEAGLRKSFLEFICGIALSTVTICNDLSLL
ncbi:MULTISPECIES: JAB domain-containing protein [Latilactobacillus]|uniref:DNA repair protein RadC n=1 Tax=Latilactobacillus sakei TaxID=1599 RepID=A0AAX0V896_LATSK|nr:MULTISPECIES: JAB domain-containing protein [Latilactobacillus]MCP8859492.1 hypothetical protein [Latilactobacillus curvatus]MCT3526113.1 DNA repair protein RadC [Latilactobacillus curvatus]PKX76003.1 DNA repair protein RadC [Latilactobacillus sakei]USG05166.1 hypothetical protein A4W87_09785 [Latilactobacillus sakei]USG07044.1 hypothetical protein A4W88_10360 [Latilactobacillus sakei]